MGEEKHRQKVIDAANQRESYQKWRLMRNIKKLNKHLIKDIKGKQRKERGAENIRKKIGKKKHLLFVGIGSLAGRRAENKIKNFTPYQFC